MYWLWSGFCMLVAALVLVQRATRRGPNATARWFALGLAFVGFVYPVYQHAWFGAKLVEPSDRPGADAALMFAATYLFAYVLAREGGFVVALLARTLRVEPVGIGTSIVLRAVALLSGAYVALIFDDAVFVFGGYLAYQALVALIGVSDPEHDSAPSDRRVPMLRVELAFAADTIASLAVSKTSFVIVSANLLALVAARGGNPSASASSRAVALLLGLAGIRLLAAGAGL